jgi:hypothetical protein
VLRALHSIHRFLIGRVLFVEHGISDLVWRGRAEGRSSVSQPVEMARPQRSGIPDI